MLYFISQLYYYWIPFNILFRYGTYLFDYLPSHWMYLAVCINFQYQIWIYGIV